MNAVARRVRSLILLAPFALVQVPASAGDADRARSAAVLEQLASAREKGLDVAELLKMDLANVALTRADAAAARTLLWEMHVARLRKEHAEEFEKKVLTEGKLTMPFFTKTFGERPRKGHSLWISLHGGGGAPKAVNDQQWENQKRLYSLEEGIYLAPRAPTNTWNLWHEGHIDRLFGRLIEDFIVLGGVDPDRVYVLGYSAGGDGVYQIAPRLADRWAAAGMMAGHPNDASPLNLRNVAFALQVGANDSAYNRNKVAAEWGKHLERLQADDPGGYTHLVKIHEGKGHWMDRQDALALPWMTKFTRNPTPERIVWRQHAEHDRSYWLAVPPGESIGGAVVIAERKGQTIRIENADKIKTLLIRLDDRFTDLDQPVRVVKGEKVLFEGRALRTIATLLRTLQGRGDPRLMYDAEVAVNPR